MCTLSVIYCNCCINQGNQELIHAMSVVWINVGWDGNSPPPPIDLEWLAARFHACLNFSWIEFPHYNMALPFLVQLFPSFPLMPFLFSALSSSLGRDIHKPSLFMQNGGVERIPSSIWREGNGRKGNGRKCKKQNLQEISENNVQCYPTEIIAPSISEGYQHSLNHLSPLPSFRQGNTWCWQNWKNQGLGEGDGRNVLSKGKSIQKQKEENPRGFIWMLKSTGDKTEPWRRWQEIPSTTFLFSLPGRSGAIIKQFTQVPHQWDNPEGHHGLWYQKPLIQQN